MPYLQTPAGRKIYYEQHGDSGPVVILVHGLASSGRIWVRQVKALRKVCRVYTFDFPGHGESDRQARYSLASLADLIENLMDECEIARANVMAISVGCSVALTFAARHPERVDKLILEGPIGGVHSGWHPIGILDHFMFWLLPVLLQASIRIFGVHATARWLNTFGVKAKRNFKILESVQSRTDFKAIRQLLWESARTSYTGQVERIMAPTLVVRGAKDPTPRRFTNYILKRLRSVTFVEVPETRHLVAMEKPKEFNRIAMEFLGVLTETLRSDPVETLRQSQQ